VLSLLKILPGAPKKWFHDAAPGFYLHAVYWIRSRKPTFVPLWAKKLEFFSEEIATGREIQKMAKKVIHLHRDILPRLIHDLVGIPARADIWFSS